TDLTLLLINTVEEPIFYLSSDFIILDLNAFAKKIFKITKNSIIGKPFSVLCSDQDLKSLEHPFDRNLKTCLRKKIILWDSLCLKKPINGIQYIAIGTFKNQTNKSALNSNLKTNTDGTNPIDITSQFLTEQINDKSKNTSDYVYAIYRYMENIIAQIPVSVYWMNKNHVYMGCSNNMVKLLNLNSRYDIVGKTYEDLYHEKSTSYYKKADKIVMDKGIPLSLEEPFYCPDGTTKEIYLSNKVPLRDLEGKIIGMLGVSVDITDRKKMELELSKAKEAAEEANNVKTEFIANMSHDLRTPLSGVVGMAELMKEQVTDPVQVQYAEWIFDCSQQLLSLLDGILDIVSLGNVKEDELKITTFDINECIAELVHLEMPSIKLKQLDLIVNIDKKVPRLIKTDRIKLHRIILNLLGNAIKFTDSGYIAIDVKLLELNNESGLIYFAISDTGIGIPENQQTKIFDRFHRIIPSSIGKYKGHGVGLHIVQSYVNLLGGEIQVNSEPGVGTTFYFELPIQIEKENEVTKGHYKLEKNIIPVPKKEKILDKNSKNEFLYNSPNILILEDNLVARRTIESLATQEKCRFVSVAKGKEAIRLAKTNEFDLIITDIGLPDIEGHVVAKLIREWELSQSKPPIPIIGLTAHIKEKSKEICLKSGMDDVFNKPISRQLLQYILSRFIPSKNKNPTSCSSQKTASSEQIIEADLPESESNFFNLEAYPLLDIHNAVSIMGSLKLVREILPLMIGEETQKDVESIEKAFHIKDWETVERIAHKMKGGAANCGAVRMKYACQYLERYQKMGYTKLLEPLYQQLIKVVEDTQKNIHEWLKH
ncbi:TPA: response regulator, partial [Legionella pneumophila subsp. pneumophila]|nr:response regulator [Legionella pneumophila subsp. pneumophila]